MFTPTTFGLALLMMIVSAACWGIEVSSNGRYAVATGIGTGADIFKLDELYPAGPSDLPELIRRCETLSVSRIASGTSAMSYSPPRPTVWLFIRVCRNFSEITI